MTSSYIFQIFLRVTIQNQIRIAQRIVVDEVVQFRPLRHGHVQFILDPDAVDSYSVRYKYKDHSGKPCEGWESFKTKKEAQERKITVEKELLDGTFLVPDTMTVEEMLYKWIPIQSTKHKWSPKTYTQSVAMVQNLIVPYIGKRKVQELRTYDIEKSSMQPSPRPPAGSTSTA